ncbi:hypothetical protein CEUSTIGMA_g13961.t1 [Chlamydomonas eustigma]|uniref:Uncharacterized protein n=1 Tax=Chlamydomonas eustigma TaxID=1157962 RepID=A0A250XU31_9CHLO|nr:hypothetical protein CEUSTIGMA_g13961.t1 [Chlamydomonas eustigma]|eukprot:GAX86554.1 hypothetical protein CEUSTIGMA_g13961.t1 [Chlamydomonas eustigma]
MYVPNMTSPGHPSQQVPSFTAGCPDRAPTSWAGANLIESSGLLQAAPGPTTGTTRRHKQLPTDAPHFLSSSRVGINHNPHSQAHLHPHHHPHAPTTHNAVLQPDSTSAREALFPPPPPSLMPSGTWGSPSPQSSIMRALQNTNHGYGYEAHQGHERPQMLYNMFMPAAAQTAQQTNGVPTSAPQASRSSMDFSRNHQQDMLPYPVNLAAGRQQVPQSGLTKPQQQQVYPEVRMLEDQRHDFTPAAAQTSFSGLKSNLVAARQLDMPFTSDAFPVQNHDVCSEEVMELPNAVDLGESASGNPHAGSRSDHRAGGRNEGRSLSTGPWYSNAAKMILDEMPRAREAAAATSHAMKCNNQHCKEVAETMAAVLKLLEVKDEMIWQLIKDRGDLIAAKQKER